ncbi:LysR family substrate-binding domain-containing protein [Agromyces tardus]|uniref:LysR family substrate-binding domain-containing protein n=1 Tax=Agromyces tardus TaxID=2583849 RepID=UPI001484FD2E|nr:LysR family substrate-binding domain-containing protein [Agromyces tardus]
MALRLDYVAGVSPAKWLRAWAGRRPDLPLEATRVEQAEQLTSLRAGEADVAFVRLPIDAEGLHAIPLWEEVAVAVLPKEHPLAEADSLELADLEGEPRAPEQPDAAMTVELVAAGTGLALLPHGVARLHHRRDVVAIPVTDAAHTRIALVWRVERDDADIQEFVGVVRGRTARSSRGDAADDAEAAKSAPSRRPAQAKGTAPTGGGKRAGTEKSGGTRKSGGGKGGGRGAKQAPRGGRKSHGRGGRGR